MLFDIGIVLRIAEFSEAVARYRFGVAA